MNHHLATREIGIDAAHRVPNHHSKCRNLHGHRYTVQATARGPLLEAGSSEGMVVDFSFLKTMMMEEIDAPCDHGLILWLKDPLLATLIEGFVWRSYAPDAIMDLSSTFGKIHAVPFVPTAENLARYWYERISKKMLTALPGSVTLASLRVYETPNCWADYPAPEPENHHDRTSDAHRNRDGL